MTSDSNQHKANLLITGASGMVGTALREHLQASYNIHALSRSDPAADFYYDQNQNRMHLDPEIRLQGVINLAGANISDKRWSAARKQEIVKSRTETTLALSEALARLDNKPEFLLSASAIGYYGETGTQPVDESASPANDFLGKLSQDWEKACEPASESGVRCVQMRFGLVLSPAGGVLKNFILPFRLASVGQLGKGEHFMSWISIDDLLLIITALIRDTAFDGPINCVAPEAVTNADFMRLLAKTLHRPKLPAIPAPIVRLMFGEMADATLLLSSRVESRRIKELGITLQHPTLAGALEDLLHSS